MPEHALSARYITMGKSIRSNSKKAFRSQRRGLIGEEPAVQKAEAARIAALAKCLAAPPKEGLSAVDPGPGPSKLAHQDAMELDGGEAGTASRSRSRGRSRQRGQPEAAEGSGAPVASPAALDGDVDMDADPAQVAKSVRGPNQYKCAVEPA